MKTYFGIKPRRGNKGDTEMKLKRKGLWTISIGVLISGGLLAVEHAHSQLSQGQQGGATTCSLATLKGQYLFAGTGTLFPPAFGLTETAVAASAGYHIFNGDGTGMDFVTFAVNGVVVPVQSPVDITYTLGSDCTGTYTVHNKSGPAGPHFNIFVALDGEELSVIETDTGASIAEGPDRRVGSTNAQ